MAPVTGASMVVQVLAEVDRRKLDGADDALFYAVPRFVQHLDGGFRARLTDLCSTGMVLITSMYSPNLMANCVGPNPRWIAMRQGCKR